jgi:hypothetical protein
MNLISASLRFLVAGILLCGSIAANAQYIQVSFTATSTDFQGDGSETVNPTNLQGTITSQSSSTATDSYAKVTYTNVWRWNGGGAPQNPFTLVGHGNLSGSAQANGGSAYAESIVDGSIYFGFKRTADTGVGGPFGNYSNGGSQHPDVNGVITVTIYGECDTTTSGAHALATSYCVEYVHTN